MRNELCESCKHERVISRSRSWCEASLETPPPPEEMPWSRRPSRWRWKIAEIDRSVPVGSTSCRLYEPTSERPNFWPERLRGKIFSPTLLRVTEKDILAVFELVSEPRTAAEVAALVGGPKKKLVHAKVVRALKELGELVSYNRRSRKWSKATPKESSSSLSSSRV